MNRSLPSRQSAALFVSILVCGLAISGCSERARQSTAAFEELVAAERAFAAASLANGMHDAFLEYLGPDSIVFRPGPVDGRQAQQEAPPDSGTLNWYPMRAEISASGAFGYTTGPWEYTVEGRKPAYGHYVSVWRKEADGPWRVALDIGTGHPRPADWEEPHDPRNSGPERAAVGEGVPDSLILQLLDRDREHARAWQEQGAARAYRDFGTKDLTLYRNGTLPLEGEEVFALLTVGGGEVVECTPLGAGVSDAGDLGYTYGTLRVRINGTVDSRSYARIWRNLPAGGFRLVIDVEIPLPDPDEAA